MHGDMRKIEKMTGYTQRYVIDVLTGRRYNEKILRTAIKLAKFNRENKLINQ